MTGGSRTIRMGMEVNRVEGDMEIQVEVKGNVVTDAWCGGTMYRGYEQILTGRDPADALVITPRICGICSTSHLYAATSALEMAYATPIAPKDVAAGETIWAVVRALLYSAAYLLVITALGLVESPWAILALPACFVIGFGFAGAGIAAVTWMRTWKDFDLIQLVMLPMFMFSATFYPITVYPTVIEWIVRCLPLYHGIELVRSLTTGTVGPFQLVNVAYLMAMGFAGLWLSARRIDKLLLK